MTQPAAQGVASPCIDICRMNPVRGLCEGCLRTREEIARWRSMDDAGRLEVLDRIEARRLAA